MKRAASALVLSLVAFAANGATFTFTTGTPDAAMAMGTRPASAGVEVEPADDFILASCTSISTASFYGLITNGKTVSDITEVDVEIYRIFPLDSNTSRTPGVPTRNNSPSDVAFDTRSSTGGGLTFSGTVLGAFATPNSVLNNIAVNAGGEGPVSGQEVQITINFPTPFSLPAGHYFIVPQVAVTGGTFYWLSAPHSPPAFTGDLQAWIRNAPLDPDWLRVGTDIVGGATPPTFNGAFSIGGTTVSVNASNPSPLSATEGAAISPTTFSVSGSSGTFTFSETGTLPSGVTLSTGGTLSGTPAEEGSFPITVTATDSGGCSASLPFTINVGDAGLTAAGVPIAYPPSVTFSGPVATFHDANTAAPASDFTATINWGDSTTSAGVVTSNGGGNFTVSGTHAFSGNGPFTVTTTITDIGGSTAMATSTAAVSFGIPTLAPGLLMLLAAMLAAVALRSLAS